MDIDKALHELGCELFYSGGSYDRALELIEGIAEWLAKGGYPPDPDSGSGYSWDVFMAGAYHYCVEHHSGQTSDEYRIQCLIGKFYTPSFSGKLDGNSEEWLVYYNLMMLADEE